MEHQTVPPTAPQKAAPVAQKLPYDSPKVTFVPLVPDERLSKARKKGSFTVPLGCC